MKRTVGNIAKGRNFWPRQPIVDPILRALGGEAGSSRSLFGLRRIGKSSVLCEVERQLRARDDILVIHIDAQGTARFEDFLRKLAEGLPAEGTMEKAKKWAATSQTFRAAIEAVVAKLNPSPPAGEPKSSKSASSALVQQAYWSGDFDKALRDAAPLVLIVDELPYMLRDMMECGHAAADINRLLAIFRNWRLNCGVRMLVSGSIGLAHLARTYRIATRDHTGDLVPVHVPPLSSADAIAMLDNLATGEAVNGWKAGLSEAIADAVIERWPIFQQYAFEAVADSAVRDPAEAAQLVKTTLGKVLDETFYSQFKTRLDRYDADKPAARTILKLLVKAKSGQAGFKALDTALGKAGCETRRDDVLEALVEDDVVIADTGAQTVRFASRIVSVWVRAQSWGR